MTMMVRMMLALAALILSPAALAENQFKLLVFAMPSTYHYEYIYMYIYTCIYSDILHFWNEPSSLLVDFPPTLLENASLVEGRTLQMETLVGDSTLIFLCLV